jgi:Icc-related predicted phosphoesterase
MPLRIAVVTDIHHGEDSHTKKGSAALRLIADFARFVDDIRPDAVLELGDRISDRDRDADLVLAREVADAFRAVNATRYHVCGNHDRDFLTVADNEAAFGQSLANQIVDLGDWRLVLWRADTMIRRPAEGSRFHLEDSDLDWLREAVATAAKPLIVASHVPLSGQSQISNYYFERNTHVATYPDLARVHAVLRQAAVPVICLAGHVHWNSLTFVDAIPHITLQSLTETCTTGGEAAAAWGLLEIDSTNISWRAYGIETFGVQLDIASTARRWPAPLGPFGGRKTAWQPTATP